MVLHHVGLAAAPSPPWYQLRLPEELLQTKLTMDEIAAIAVAATTLLSVLLMLLHGMFLWVIRLPCLQSWLLAMEVNAEVAAMNQSVQYAFATAMRDPIDAALESATPGGPPTSAAGFANRGRHRGAASVNDYAPVLILAEAKANSSAADDRRKTQPAMAVEIHKPAMKGRRGRAGALVDKRGRATLVYPGDGVYEGEYRDGKKEGKGKFWYVEGTVYEGTWKDDMKHGGGKETYSDGATYEGRFQEGSRHGHGTLTYANGDVYEGTWDEDVKHGSGVFRWGAGTSYEGEFADGLMHGQGTYYFADGCVYQGEYAEGKRNGRGVYRFLDGSFFEGEYRDGVVDGRGTFTFADGSAEVGRWEDGRPVGEATRFSPDHNTAWRLFDGQVTGPVSLDLADVIAQMAFRPRAARLARAVRDQLAAVRLDEERRRFASPEGSKRSYSASRSPSPMGERPPWQGVMEIFKKSETSPQASPQSSPPLSPATRGLLQPTCTDGRPLSATATAPPSAMSPAAHPALAQARATPKKKISPTLDPMRLLSRRGASATPFNFSPGRGLRLGGAFSGSNRGQASYMA